MEILSNGQKLQQAYRDWLQPYSPHLQFAATLTMKQRAKIRFKRFDNSNERYEEHKSLDEAVLNSQIKYFTALLTHTLFGNAAKHKNTRGSAKPLLIVAVEGQKTGKRIHLHLALGNIPAAKLDNMDAILLSCWQRCEFSYKQNLVKPISNANGWLDYITKEVGYTNDDALDIASMCIPTQFI